MKPEQLITALSAFHRCAIVEWKQNTSSRTQRDFLSIAEENHAFNFQLWHAEDRARRDDLGFEHVYHAKREIDQCNQQRNNRMEEMDQWLSQQFKPVPPGTCPVHSETPGMMIDRLSILALKHYHMAEQARRMDVDDEHRLRCQNKAQIIEWQQQQLQENCRDLLQQVVDRERTFILYHQFKMYNDPTLNPELYAQSL